MHRKMYRGTYSNQTLRKDIRNRKSTVLVKDQRKQSYCTMCSSHSCRVQNVNDTIFLSHTKKALNKQNLKFKSKYVKVNENEIKEDPMDSFDEYYEFDY